jgi:cytochrome c
MDSFEFTKIFGALLAAGLVASLSGFITSKIYPEYRGEVRATLVAAAEAEPQGTAPGAAEAPAEVATGVAALLAAADPAAGAKAIKKCTACHSLNQGGKNRLGPNLWDIIGRPVASAAGYKYSKALKSKSGETWSYGNLDVYLTKPKAWAPGTKMAFAGLKKPERRADLIAHLRSLSDNPAALPE